MVLHTVTPATARSTLGPMLCMLMVVLVLGISVTLSEVIKWP